MDKRATKGQPRPSIKAQQAAVAAWLERFAGRRASEATMEVISYSPQKRRQMFSRLVQIGCVDHVGGKWAAVKGLEEVRDGR